MIPKIYSNWDLQSDFESDKNIEIYVDTFPPTIYQPNIIKIIIIQEVFNIENLRKLTTNYKSAYDYIFTYDQEILNTNEKAIPFLCINTWISNYIFKEKIFGISTLIGGKTNNLLEGYNIRHQLWNKQNQIKISKQFYLSSYSKYKLINYENQLVLGDNKNDMFDTQYHIAIENTSYKNMFTEKLIDCFQTKTIPIYYGCSNISDYFNIDGIMIAYNIDDIINICNNVKPDYYESKIEAIEDNYNRSMKYLSHKQILDNKLAELLNN